MQGHRGPAGQRYERCLRPIKVLKIPTGPQCGPFFIQFRIISELDLADQINGGLQSLLTGFPFSRANHSGICFDELGSLNLTEKFFGVAADAFVMNFADNDTALGVDHECTALSKTGAFDHNAEVAGHLACRIAEHREFDFLDGLGRIVPSLVCEVCIGGNGINFTANLLELCIVSSQILKLGRADEREVSRVEENH